MSKRRNSNHITQIVLPDTMTQDALSSILADAIVKAQDIQIQREKKEKEEVSKELNRIFRIVNVPEKKGIKKRLFTIVNNVWFVIAFPFKRFDTSKDNRITLCSVKLILVSFLTILQATLLLTDLFGAVYLYRYCTFNHLIYIFAMFAAVHLLLSICHGMKLEISNMKDSSLLFNIAALLIAVLALVVSFVPLILGGLSYVFF